MTTKDLTKLQAEMDFLAGVKCPCLVAYQQSLESGRCIACGICGHSDEPDVCLCNGSGLDPKYDVLRVECPKVNFHGPEGYGAGHRDRCPNWITLPADRAHEAVGELLIVAAEEGLVLSRYLPKSTRWFCDIAKEAPKRWGGEISGPTPEEALIAALCEAEGVTI